MPELAPVTSAVPATPPFPREALFDGAADGLDFMAISGKNGIRPFLLQK
jgi:hypothetical protein